jgi:hypothetical protein
MPQKVNPKKKTTTATKTASKKPTAINRDSYYENRLAIIKESIKKQQKKK